MPRKKSKAVREDSTDDDLEDDNDLEEMEAEEENNLEEESDEDDEEEDEEENGENDGDDDSDDPSKLWDTPDDKRKLAAMTEVQREGILYSRREKKRKIRERRDAAQRLKKQKADVKREQQQRVTRAANSKATKRGAQKESAADKALADIASKQGRKRVSVYAAEGSDTEEEDQSAKRKKQRRRGRDDDVNNEEEQEEEEEEEDSEGDGVKKPKSRTPVTLHDIRRIQITRKQLEKLFGEPYFEAVIKNRFVRVSYSRGGTQLYRMAEVVGIDEYPAYEFKNQKVSKALRLVVGRSPRIFSMNLVSNGVITTENLEEYKKVLAAQEVDCISKEECKARKREADRIVQDFVYDGSSVSQLLEIKKRLSKKRLNITYERNHIQNRRETAAEEGNTEVVAQLDRELAELDEFALLQRQDNGKAAVQMAAGLIQINEKNKARSIKEKAKLKRQMNAKEARERKTGKVEDFDPFLTKRTNASVPWFPPEKVKENADNWKKEAAAHEADKLVRHEARKVKRRQVAAALNLLEDIDDVKLDAEIARAATGSTEDAYVTVTTSEMVLRKMHDLHTTTQLNIDIDADQPLPFRTLFRGASHVSRVFKTKPPLDALKGKAISLAAYTESVNLYEDA